MGKVKKDNALEKAAFDPIEMAIEEAQKAARYSAASKSLWGTNYEKMLAGFEGLDPAARATVAFKLGRITSRLDTILDAERSLPIISGFPSNELCEKMKGANDPEEVLFECVAEYLETAFYIGYCRAIADECLLDSPL